LGCHLVVVLAKEREAEALRAHKIVEPLLARRAAASAVLWISDTGQKASDCIAPSTVICDAGDFRCGVAIECEVAGGPAGVNGIDPVQAPLRPEFQVMLSAEPTD